MKTKCYIVVKLQIVLAFCYYSSDTEEYIQKKQNSYFRFCTHFVDFRCLWNCFL